MRVRLTRQKMTSRTRTRTKIDAEGERYSWNERRAELQAPRNLASVLYDHVSRKPKEYAEGGPELPSYELLNFPVDSENRK
jgi:hypothetical protein